MIIRNISGGTIHLGWYNQGVDVANAATLTLSEEYVNNTSYQKLLDDADFEVVSYSNDPDQRHLVQSELEVMPYDNTTSGLAATTIPGAIDEIVTSGGGIPATGVSYDPTTSGMAAATVQAAIDEFASSAAGDGATHIGFDNTTSGMTAATVQAAIDELSSTTSGDGATHIGFSNTASGLTGANVQAVIDEVANIKKYYHGNVTINGATATILAVPVAAGKYVGIEVHVVAYNAGGESAYYEGHILATDAAVVTSHTNALESVGAAAWDCTFAFGGGNVNIQGTNGAGDVLWTATANVVTGI